MPRYRLTLFVLAGVCMALVARSQQISKQDLISLTPEWQGERFDDGRPKVPDSILERMKNATLEEAWAVLRNKGYNYQYEGDWQMVHPDGVLVGRAVTATFMPGRKDIHEALTERGQAQGFKLGMNTWPIGLLQPGDVYVADQFDATVDGPTVGDNLANSIMARSGNGFIYAGAIRDIAGMKSLDDFTVYFKSYHPSHHNGSARSPRLNTTLIGINTPTRIGMATVMAGDVVLARDGGVLFIPPQFAEEVVKVAEVVRLRDTFGHLRLQEGVYTAGQIDTRWSDEIETDFSRWLEAHIDELPVAREQIQELLQSRTW